MTTLQQEHDQFLIDIKSKMLNKETIIDSAIYDINNFFFESIFCEGGDDELADFDPNRFAFHMTIRLTESDIELWDNDNESELYDLKKQEVLTLIKSGQLNLS